ncbi:12396_t:CDS:2 [Dentiscutata erythropus]|uniref:12396_t:CDS:1 n=1 Tax=Dentiscutata erythropus TaxID=1348616 RepID=A0A9N9AZK8_9GLOM|nr:12396_t:CDS:2 [Dentiscutata erythropus]
MASFSAPFSDLEMNEPNSSISEAETLLVIPYPYSHKEGTTTNMAECI